MKLALPENAKIAKEAKECMQECVSEFISFITSEGQWDFLSNQPRMLTDRFNSLGEVPAGKAQNRQRRRHPIRHDIPRL
jgi:hypothetical protein